VIRRFDVSDIESILDIQSKSFPKAPYDRGAVMAYSAMHSDSFLVYEESGKILGYAIFEPGGHILSIAVDPDHRRKRVGIKLMKEVLENLKTAWIEVSISNLTAQRFYEKQGFKKKGIIKNYYETDDGLIMVYER
jgi:ribosomal-protein-alanine N-acetyltransferase